MTGTVELDPDRRHLQIRFPYREDLVAEVKSLPQRKWDRAGKVWRVPISHTEAVYKLFTRYLFQFAPEVMSILAGTLGAPAENTATDGDDNGLLGRGEGGTRAKAPQTEPEAAPDPATREGALSISELNARVRDAIRSAFPALIWIQGEIVDLDKSEGRRARFFELIEKREGEERPRASLDVALFENTLRSLIPRLASAPEPLTLQDGIQIRAQVRVDLYPEHGQYRAVIEDIDPTFTLGKFALERERILRELRRTGLDRINLARPMPVPALRIGVLTSPESDGWNDFHRHLEESGIGFQVSLAAIRVQGKDLKPTLLAGLQWFAERALDFDVLCILRGGGSRSDLAWFDDLDIATAVARHPLKILVGIGHHRDCSVLDEIAHSEKTPTATAAFLCQCITQARAELAERIDRLGDAAHQLLAQGREVLLDRAGRMRSATAGRLATARERLGHGAERLVRECRRALRDSGRQLDAAGARLGRLATVRLLRERDVLGARQSLLARNVTLCLQRTGALLDGRAELLRLLDPRTALARGFALVLGRDGKVLTSTRQLAKGKPFAVRMRDGIVDAVAESIQPEPES